MTISNVSIWKTYFIFFIKFNNYMFFIKIMFDHFSKQQSLHYFLTAHFFEFLKFFIHTAYARIFIEIKKIGKIKTIIYKTAAHYTIGFIV